DHLLATLDAERLGWIAEDMAELLAGAGENADLARYYLRIKGAWKLPVADQYVLARLAEWRERLARELDKPRGHIVPDGVLVEAVRLRPLSRNQLFRVEGFHPRPARQFGDQLLAQIEALANQPVPADFIAVPEPLEREARQILAGL